MIVVAWLYSHHSLSFSFVRRSFLIFCSSQATWFYSVDLSMLNSTTGNSESAAIHATTNCESHNHVCDSKTSPTHSLTHSLTAYLTYTHSLTHPPTHPPRYPPTHSLTAFLAHIIIIIKLHVCCALYCLTCSAYNSITIFLMIAQSSDGILMHCDA